MRSGDTKSEAFGLSINNLVDQRRAGMALQALRVAEAVAVISHLGQEPRGKLGRDAASARPSSSCFPGFLIKFAWPNEKRWSCGHTRSRASQSEASTTILPLQLQLGQRAGVAAERAARDPVSSPTVVRQIGGQKQSGGKQREITETRKLHPPSFKLLPIVPLQCCLRRGEISEHRFLVGRVEIGARRHLREHFSPCVR